jgi:hypothetical protein
MVGMAGELGGEARLADYGRDSRDGKAFGFEDRPLLDVDFDETQHICIERCIADFAGVQSKGTNRLFQGDAIRIFESQQRWVKATGHCPAAEEWHSEAHTLLLRECDHLDGQGKFEFLRQVSPFQSECDPEDTVICARAGNRVNVRAKNQSFGMRARRLPQTAQISRRIGVHGHSEAFHAAAQKIVNFVHGRREEAARDAARLFAHLGDLPAFGDGALCGLTHDRTCSLPRA